MSAGGMAPSQHGDQFRLVDRPRQADQLGPATHPPAAALAPEVVRRRRWTEWCDYQHAENTSTTLETMKD
jgi:hypothetical protein